MTARTLGIDMGQRRIGVAVSDSLGITAQPVGVVARTTPHADLATLSKLAAEHAVSVIVIGLPLTLQGTRGPQAQRDSRRMVRHGMLSGRRPNLLDRKRGRYPECPPRPPSSILH